MSKRLLIIGSTGSGQTSLLKHLSAAGFECVKGNAYADAYDVGFVICCYKTTAESMRFLEDNLRKACPSKSCVAVLNTVADANFAVLTGPLAGGP